MKWIKKHLVTLILVLVMIGGLCLLLYPTAADYWNKFHQSRAIASYSETVANMDDDDYEEMWNTAVAYNEKLAQTGINLNPSESELEEYNNALNISGTGIMGYIEIDKINCYLPIYHGTDEAVLQIAVGHIEGTSLPVGGESTHCVLSGHRGLPSAKLFTDLDQMEIGDTFIIRTLDETLTYEVDQILIVEPEDTSALAIEEGQDYCTLVTCTPYGINTHRLLVRGHRVENEKQVNDIRVTSDAMQIDPVMVAPFAAIPLLLFLLVVLIVTSHKKSTRTKAPEQQKKSKESSRPKKAGKKATTGKKQEGE